MSIVSGSIAAIKGAKSQDKATKTNKEAQQSTNALNYRFWLQSRGMGVGRDASSVKGYKSSVLPFYFGKNGEANLARDAMAYYEATGEDPATLFSRYSDINESMAPAIAAGDETVNRVFNGGITDERLGNLRPVFAARTGVARDSGMEALNETLNEITNIQARKGFTGDSLAANRLRFDARRKIGSDVAMVGLQNKTEEAGVRNAGIDLRLANLNTPLRRAQDKITFSAAPASAVGDYYQRRLNPFSFFRIGTQPFQAAPLPKVEANATSSQIAANSISQAGQQALKLYLSGAFGGGAFA
jgi:hypothetical protein